MDFLNISGGKFQSRSIRYRLIAFGATIIVPLLAGAAWWAIETARLQRQLIAMQRLDISTTASHQVDQEIAGIIGMLKGLASSPDLVRGGFRAFQSHASTLALHPDISDIWAFSSAGGAVSATTESPLPASRDLPSDFINAVFSGRTVVSDVRGEGLEHANVVIAILALDGGRPVYGLAATYRLRNLSGVFARAGMATTWAAAIIDGHGRYVARSLDAERRVGQVARPELVDVARSISRAGTFENVTYEGVTMANSYARSTLTGWTTVVAVPVRELSAPLQWAIFLLALVGALILGLAMIAATRHARVISDSVRELSRFATALGRGATEAPQIAITELEEVQAALERALQESARLSAIVASSGDAIMSMALDGTVLTWNKGAEHMFGYSAADIVGRKKTLIVPAAGRDEFRDHCAAVAAGKSAQIESVRQRRDGTLVDVSIDAAPILDLTGEVVAISSILHDISERKAHEEHLRVLMREIAHRSKNQLAVVQSLATQTGRRSVNIGDFLERLRTRLQGLAASNDLLTARNWREAPLGSLVRSHLDMFNQDFMSRIDMQGPDVNLTVAAAEAIGLALHELATNSLKYGALSGSTGRILISWEIVNDPKEPFLQLTWAETGGPAVGSPVQRGFGSQIIEEITPRAVKGSAHIDYTDHGLQWRLRCPLSACTSARRRDGDGLQRDMYQNTSPVA